MEETPSPEAPSSDGAGARTQMLPGVGALGGLVYNIQIQLPESRDPVVYDALFRSLKAHLFSE